MSNRASRRRDTRAFRHQAHRDHIVLTHLVDANADLSDVPMLAEIAAAWRAAIPQRKPLCFGCEASFSDTATPGAFLFAIAPSAADIASVSVLCVECWHDLSLSPDALDRAAARVLGTIVDGKFLDAP
jgi:hypothetical protein